MAEIISHATTIDEILSNPVCNQPRMLFDRYTALLPEQKDAFILALIGKAILLQKQLEVFNFNKSTYENKVGSLPDRAA